MKLFFEVSSCFCGIPLRIGCFICAVINLIFSASIVVPLYMLHFNIIHRRSTVQKYFSKYTNDWMNIIFMYVLIIDFTIITTTIIMIVELYKKRPSFIWQWICHEVTYFIVVLVFILNYIIVGLTFEALIVFAIFFAVKYPVVSVIHSYYNVLKKDDGWKDSIAEEYKMLRYMDLEGRKEYLRGKAEQNTRADAGHTNVAYLDG